MTEVTNKLNIDQSTLTQLVQITDKMRVDLQQVNSRMNVLEQKVGSASDLSLIYIIVQFFYLVQKRKILKKIKLTNRCLVVFHSTRIIVIISSFLLSHPLFRFIESEFIILRFL
jgi:hypothetical protein